MIFNGNIEEAENFFGGIIIGFFWNQKIFLRDGKN